MTTEHTNDRLHLLHRIDAELNAAGLPEPVIIRIRQIKASLLMEQALVSRGQEPRRGSVQHFVFVGGREDDHLEAARLLATTYFGLGLLDAPVARTAARSDLLEPYVGRTGDRTSAVIRDAAGGVLLIGQAPELLYSEQPDSFGEEALAALLSSDDIRQGRVCAILSGSRSGIDRLLSSSPGLSGVFHHVIDFDSGVAA
jgi:hypothetical protein